MLHTVFGSCSKLELLAWWFSFSQKQSVLNSAEWNYKFSVLFLRFASKCFSAFSLSASWRRERNETILIPLSPAKKHIWPESISGWVREGSSAAAADPHHASQEINPAGKHLWCVQARSLYWQLNPWPHSAATALRIPIIVGVISIHGSLVTLTLCAACPLSLCAIHILFATLRAPVGAISPLARYTRPATQKLNCPDRFFDSLT